MEVMYIVLFACVLVAIVIALKLMKGDESSKRCKNCKYSSGVARSALASSLQVLYEWETLPPDWRK